MATKLYDLAVKTGVYTDRQTGQEKGRWQNVGAVMQGDDGNQFIMLAKWFNPAGVPDLSGRGAGSESVLVSCFAPQERQQQASSAPQQSSRRAPAPAPADSQMLDDDIPF